MKRELQQIGSWAFIIGVIVAIAAAFLGRGGTTWTAVLVVLGATLGLAYLLLFSEKKKFYPAMPFITIGILLAMLVGLLI